jgi:hypothetical protein
MSCHALLNSSWWDRSTCLRHPNHGVQSKNGTGIMPGVLFRVTCRWRQGVCLRAHLAMGLHDSSETQQWMGLNWKVQTSSFESKCTLHNLDFYKQIPFSLRCHISYQLLCKQSFCFHTNSIYVEYSKHTDSYVRVRVKNGFQKPVLDGCKSF